MAISWASSSLPYSTSGLTSGGGSPETRRRFHLELVRRTRQAVGEDFRVMMKFGVQDEEARGLVLEEDLETARQMVAAGLDAIEVSARIGNAMRVMKEGEPEQAYLRERAAAVKRTVSVPVVCVGGIRSLAMAQNIIESGDADMIAMCRPFIREPGLVTRWLREGALAGPVHLLPEVLRRGTKRLAPGLPAGIACGLDRVTTSGTADSISGRWGLTSKEECYDLD